VAHTSRTGFTFKMAIELLESPKELQQILESLGEKHRKFCLTTEHFEVNILLFLEGILLKINNIFTYSKTQ